MVQLQEVIKEAQKHLSLVITEFKQLLLWLPHLWVTSLSQEPSKGQLHLDCEEKQLMLLCVI